MTQQQTGQEHPIILEIVAEDERDSDPVAIGEVGREILDAVKRDGVTAKPVYTGQRGGLELLFELFNYAQSTAQMVGADVYAQRDAIGVVGNICTILGFVSPIAFSIFKTQKHPVKLSIVIDGIPITVEAANLKDAEAMLERARQVAAAHPNIQVTPQSQVKVRVAVPKKPQRKRL